MELDGPRRVMTTSDKEGRYESGVLEPGDYRISVRAPGYVPAQYGQREVQDRGEVLDVRAGQLTSGVSSSNRRPSSQAVSSTTAAKGWQE